MGGIRWPIFCYLQSFINYLCIAYKTLTTLNTRYNQLCRLNIWMFILRHLCFIWWIWWHIKKKKKNTMSSFKIHIGKSQYSKIALFFIKNFTTKLWNVKINYFCTILNRTDQCDPPPPQHTHLRKLCLKTDKN